MMVMLFVMMVMLFVMMVRLFVMMVMTFFMPIPSMAKTTRVSCSMIILLMPMIIHPSRSKPTPPPIATIPLRTHCMFKTGATPASRSTTRSIQLDITLSAPFSITPLNNFLLEPQIPFPNIPHQFLIPMLYQPLPNPNHQSPQNLHNSQMRMLKLKLPGNFPKILFNLFFLTLFALQLFYILFHFMHTPFYIMNHPGFVSFSMGMVMLFHVLNLFFLFFFFYLFLFVMVFFLIQSMHFLFEFIDKFILLAMMIIFGML